MEFVAFILAAYWRQILALLLVVAIGQWIIANALLVVSIIVALIIAAALWFARALKANAR